MKRFHFVVEQSARSSAPGWEWAVRCAEVEGFLASGETVERALIDAVLLIQDHGREWPALLECYDTEAPTWTGTNPSVIVICEVNA